MPRHAGCRHGSSQPVTVDSPAAFFRLLDSAALRLRQAVSNRPPAADAIIASYHLFFTSDSLPTLPRFSTAHMFIFALRPPLDVTPSFSPIFEPYRHIELMPDDTVSSSIRFIRHADSCR
jgi:hypothetical protein